MIGTALVLLNKEDNLEDILKKYNAMNNQTGRIELGTIESKLEEFRTTFKEGTRLHRELARRLGVTKLRDHKFKSDKEELLIYANATGYLGDKFTIDEEGNIYKRYNPKAIFHEYQVSKDKYLRLRRKNNLFEKDIKELTGDIELEDEIKEVFDDRNIKYPILPQRIEFLNEQGMEFVKSAPNEMLETKYDDKKEIIRQFRNRDEIKNID